MLSLRSIRYLATFEVQHSWVAKSSPQKQQKKKLEGFIYIITSLRIYFSCCGSREDLLRLNTYSLHGHKGPAKGPKLVIQRSYNFKSRGFHKHHKLCNYFLQIYMGEENNTFQRFYSIFRYIALFLQPCGLNP